MIFVSPETPLGFGDGPFEDAWALEWIDDLLERGWDAVRTALIQAKDIERTLADDVIVWAAAAVTGSAAPHHDLPGELRVWLQVHSGSRPTDLDPLAREALIRLARASTLRDAMRSRRRIRTWLLGLDALSRRLGAGLPGNLVPALDTLP